MKKSFSPLISVIVPVYNAEKFLRNCINSILGQSYSNFEILLIDDGSLDTSREICEEYATSDSRVKFFHKENGGVSSARNYAIKHASGQWFCCVDADDVVLEDYLRDFVDNVERNVTIYIQGHCMLKQGKNTAFLYKKSGICTIDSIFDDNRLSSHGYAWAKMFNLAQVREARIKYREEVGFCEDLLFVLDLLCFNKCVKYIEKSNYCYYIRENEDNASSKIFNVDNELNVFQSFCGIVENISRVYKKDFSKKKCVAETFSMLFARVRNSFYYNRTVKYKRLNFYHSLKDNDLCILYSCRYINAKLLWPGYYLLKKKLYNVADFFFLLLFKIK